MTLKTFDDSGTTIHVYLEQADGGLIEVTLVDNGDGTFLSHREFVTNSASLKGSFASLNKGQAKQNRTKAENSGGFGKILVDGDLL
jgi:hypothetical protein